MTTTTADVQPQVSIYALYFSPCQWLTAITSKPAQADQKQLSLAEMLSASAQTCCAAVSALLRQRCSASGNATMMSAYASWCRIALLQYAAQYFLSYLQVHCRNAATICGSAVTCSVWSAKCTPMIESPQHAIQCNAYVSGRRRYVQSLLAMVIENWLQPHPLAPGQALHMHHMWAAVRVPEARKHHKLVVLRP